ncbi:hypothetical protein ACJX0J_036564, partial [Zea mays]
QRQLETISVAAYSEAKWGSDQQILTNHQNVFIVIKNMDLLSIFIQYLWIKYDGVSLIWTNEPVRCPKESEAGLIFSFHHHTDYRDLITLLMLDLHLVESVRKTSAQLLVLLIMDFYFFIYSEWIDETKK